MSTAMVGLAYFQQHTGEKLGDPEAVYIRMGQILFHPLIAGFMLAAVLAAIMSTVASQLIVTSSALVEDIYKVLNKTPKDDKQYVTLGRLAVLAVSLVAIAMAWTQNDTIMGLVKFAWAGFGAAFGPLVILSLYWRKLTAKGALAGMVTGAVVVGFWGTMRGNKAGGIFDLYELLPGFLLCGLVAWLVSRATYREDPAIQAEFDEQVRITRAFERGATLETKQTA